MSIFTCFTPKEAKEENEEKEAEDAMASSLTPRAGEGKVTLGMLLRDDTKNKIDLPSFTYQELAAATREFSSDNYLGEGGFGDDTKKKIDLHSFTYRELAAATREFSSDNYLGEDHFGKAYSGTIYDKIVAVKQLDQQGLQGQREFLVEIMVLSNLNHPNLVHLKGYCCDENQRILVYEYMPLGALDEHLIGPDREPLSWTCRMKIALDVAMGLEYLHEMINPSIIYRDLKSSNILLDDQYKAKLSDVGLAQLYPIGDKADASPPVMGTTGYVAPEYRCNDILDPKIDVYSYGVLMLELITGQQAVDDNRSAEEEHLVIWARPMLKDTRRYKEFVDPRLGAQYTEKNLIKAVAIAIMCLDEEPKCRPRMSDVVLALKDLAVPDEELHLAGDQSRGNAKQAKLTRFTFQDLTNVTKNFSEGNLLGQGGFGEVYKGTLPDSGQIVAVKKLKPSGSQGQKEYLAEITVLGTLSHPNVVHLIGYSSHEDQRLLVYEYMPLGSLDTHLFGRVTQEPLSWVRRTKIALDVAVGLEYLHDKIDPPIIYRDLKSSNILLDDHYNAKISDFGLATTVPTDICLTLFGSRGHMAPEYTSEGLLSLKYDVYAFGVLILELLTGRRGMNKKLPKEERCLDIWAKPILEEQQRWKELVDPHLGKQCSDESLNQAVSIAKLCLEEDPDSRPVMSVVVKSLNQLVHLAEGPDISRKEKPLSIREPKSDEPLHDDVKGKDVHMQSDVKGKGKAVDG